MKKIIPFILILFLLLPFSTRAYLGSQGLILEGGAEELSLTKGEKEYLNVRDGRTNLPLFKGVTFYSDNTLVATVGQHSGILRANGYGTARIYAATANGDAGTILIRVTHQKQHGWLIIPALVLLGILLWIAKKYGIC